MKKEKKYLEGKRRDNDTLLEQTLFGNRLNLFHSEAGGNVQFSLADMMRDRDDE